MLSSVKFALFSRSGENVFFQSGPRVAEKWSSAIDDWQREQRVPRDERPVYLHITKVYTATASISGSRVRGEKRLCICEIDVCINPAYTQEIAMYNSKVNRNVPRLKRCWPKGHATYFFFFASSYFGVSPSFTSTLGKFAARRLVIKVPEVCRVICIKYAIRAGLARRNELPHLVFFRLFSAAPVTLCILEI